MKIGITGATGQLGRRIVKKLKEKTATDNLVALVRSPEKAKELDIEARVFDYDDSPENLAVSLKGIDHLMLVSASEVGKRKLQHENVIKAAQQAGVKWIVYTSLLHAETSSLSLAQEHVATEKTLKASKIPFTILRNGWYTENYTDSVPQALASGTLTGSAGEGKISSAPRDDYAEAAAAVLTTRGHYGEVYELSGDESYTLSDLASEVSKQSGKKVVYQNLPEREYAAALTSKGLPEGLSSAIASWDTGASNNDLHHEGRVLATLIGRPTTPMAETVSAVLNEDKTPQVL